MAHEVWDVLRGLGLGADAESVYRRLLITPDATAEDVGRDLDLSGPRMRAALDQLTGLELVDRWPGGSGRLHAASPAVALAGLLAEQQADLARRGRRVERMRTQVAAMAQEWQSARRDEEAEVQWLETPESIYGRLSVLSPATVTECLSIHPLPSHPDGYAAARAMNGELLGRGTSMRAMRQDSCRLDPPTMRHMTWLAEAGAQLRTAPLLPVKMIIFDRRTAIVEVDPQDPDRGAVQLTSPGVVGALYALFEQMWSSACDFGAPAPGRDERGVSPHERDLLRLMLDGHTDESAARKLGVSLRTVRRMMAGLATRLGARSRFQVGALAQARGWLDV
jgi:DNA-binding CsgD family transcriptional regulator